MGSFASVRQLHHYAAGTSGWRCRPQQKRAAFALAAILAAANTAAAADAFRLSLPIACEIGKSCFVQNYVDTDPGPEARDFACGSATYDGHDGSDFRLLSAAAARAGVPVLAPADGVVKAGRDGLADVFADSAESKSAIKGKECGNGIVIDHGDGYETQLCHLRRNSVRVKPGDRVARGQPIGEVGYSGFAQFAHVHLTVRHHGQPLDPFTGSRAANACSNEPKAGSGLWDAAATAVLPPRPDVTVIGAGIAGGPVSTAILEADHDAAPRFAADSRGIYLYARLMHARAGDVLRFELTGPGGLQLTHDAEPIPGPKATYVGFAGKRLTAAHWPAGAYVGRVFLVRQGRVLQTAEASARID